MATVQRHIIEDYSFTSGNAAATLGFTVDGVQRGEDPSLQDEIPKQDEKETIFGREVSVDRIDIEQTRGYRDDTGAGAAFEVFCRCSSDGRFNVDAPGGDRTEPSFRSFETSFRIVRGTIPYAKVIAAPFQRPDGSPATVDVWAFRDQPEDREFLVIARTVNISGLTDDDVTDAIRIANGAKGQLHDIPALAYSIQSVNLDVYRQFLLKSPSITLIETIDGISTISITYVWESDPGSPAFGIAGTRLEPAPYRPPWHTYDEFEGDGIGGRPSIGVISLFPPIVPNPAAPGAVIPNPFLVPEGWRDLPGDPLGDI